MVTPQVQVLSVIAGLAKASGGPTFSVIALTEATVRAGAHNALATIRAPSRNPEELPSPDLVPMLRVSGFHSQRLRLTWSPSLKPVLRHYCREQGIQIIHNHGIWAQPNHAAVSLARELGLPLVISTHGMLEPWAWRYHAWRKRTAWWLWQHRDLRAAAVLRATAQQEVEALRALGLRNAIALIPNGVEIPSPTAVPRLGARQHIALFVSRIHPKKGLLNLVAAWAQVRPVGWRMVICGPEEEGHAVQVRRAAAAAGLASVFEFKSAVYGPEKDALFASAELFVLPTFSENFGIAIAEALASGLPVITTKGTPWKELHTRQCGWWIDIGVEPLVAALREAMALSDEQRKAMGQRGRELVEEKYSWPKIAADMKSVYDWVLGGGPKPSCVEMPCGYPRTKRRT